VLVEVVKKSKTLLSLSNQKSNNYWYLHCKKSGRYEAGFGQI